MPDLVAYCGLNCSDCPAHIVSKTNDDELRRTTAAKWNTPSFPVSAADIDCVGCRPVKGAHFTWCAKCAIRRCASQRKVKTCAHCRDYGCATLKEWLAQAGDEARERLEKLRATG